MGKHIINGQFQSDKYPDCPLGLVPLKPMDPMAQDLLYEYAERRREVDPEFSDDLMAALQMAGYLCTVPWVGISKVLGGTVPDGFRSCTLILNDESVKLLERLVNTGLFGVDSSQAATRLVEQGLERRFFIDESYA